MITIGRCSLSRAVTHDSPIATHPTRQRPQISDGECPLQTAYINRVATAVPPYDVHDAFRRFAQSLFRHDRRNSLLFERMAVKSGSSTVTRVLRRAICRKAIASMPKA